MHTKIVTLNASQYEQSAIPHYIPHLIGTFDMLPGEIIKADEEQLEITYTIPAYAETVAAMAEKATYIERLELSRKFSGLAAWQSRIINPKFDPDNLYIIGGLLKVAHRGLDGYIEPKFYEETDFITRYKALVVSTIQPRYSFDSLSSGSVNVRDPLCCNILAQDSIEAVEKILDEEIYHNYKMDKQNKQLVKKINYAIFRWATLILAITVLSLGIWAGVIIHETVPLQARIIESQASFMVHNYGEVIRILNNDNPTNLPRSAQYILASSFVHLENLSLPQRNAVLNQLSPASLENELLYWIWIGRGEFQRAMDIALNLGDNQLVLHTYTKLYDMVYADPIMPGVEKQQRLDQYRSRINELKVIFGGDTDG